MAWRERLTPAHGWKDVFYHASFFLAVFVFYEVGNQLWEVKVSPAEPASIHDSPAHMNAYVLWEFEKQIGMAWEKPAQEFFSQSPVMMWTFVLFYVGPHFLLTYGFIIWAYRYRYDSFPFVRNAAVLFTFTAFAFEFLFPVAPPRLVTEFGMVDTVKEFLPVNNRTPWINNMVNDYAGFPSVHTGWSFLIAVLAIRLTSSPWRWLWLLYPAMIALSIVATANHVVWDIPGALAWVGMTELLNRALYRRGILAAPKYVRPITSQTPSPPPVAAGGQ